jgi:hypothetical protein
MAVALRSSCARRAKAAGAAIKRHTARLPRAHALLHPASCAGARLLAASASCLQQVQVQQHQRPTLPCRCA